MFAVREIEAAISVAAMCPLRRISLDGGGGRAALIFAIEGLSKKDATVIQREAEVPWH
jgi:hypothetical protein